MPRPPSNTIPDPVSGTPEVHHYAKNPQQIDEERRNVHYPRKVDPDILEDYGEELIEKYREKGYRGVGDVEKACIMHHYVNQNFSYVCGWEPPREFYSVYNVAENLQGNCEEASVFLASLLLNLHGLHVKLITVSSPYRGGHLTLGVYFDTDSAERRIRQWYYDHFNLEINPWDLDFCYDESDEYYFIDPLTSRFVGDSHRLQKGGYYDGTSVNEMNSWFPFG